MAESWINVHFAMGQKYKDKDSVPRKRCALGGRTRLHIPKPTLCCAHFRGDNQEGRSFGEFEGGRLEEDHC